MVFAVLGLASSPALAEKVFTGDKTITWDCGKDPAVVISTNKAKVTITGACKEVTLTGGDVTMTIENVDDLTFTGARNKFTVTTVHEVVMNGNDNSLTADTLDSLTVNGDGNTVVYKKAKSGKDADTQDNGKKNSIAKAKDKPAAKK
jgi:hypothetical protein